MCLLVVAADRRSHRTISVAEALWLIEASGGGMACVADALRCDKQHHVAISKSRGDKQVLHSWHWVLHSWRVHRHILYGEALTF
jgi:hypothetical protein